MSGSESILWTRPLLDRRPRPIVPMGIVDIPLVSPSLSLKARRSIMDVWVLSKELERLRVRGVDHFTFIMVDVECLTDPLNSLFIPCYGPCVIFCLRK